MKIVYLLSVLFLGFNAYSQDWNTNFEEAKIEALNNKKNIVLVFQGSDWCAPCIKLDREIWATTEFKNLAKNHFIMFKVDFPRRKANKLSKKLTAQNANLAEMYNKEGFFPLVVVINSKGEILGKMGYEKITPTVYFKKLSAFEE